MKDESAETVSELLILADGTVLTRNVTPVLAEALAVLDPANEALARRIGRRAAPPDEPARREAASPAHRKPAPPLASPDMP
jgi:hypothetical protein